MPEKRLHRRKFIRVGSAASVVALAGCSGGGDGGDGEGDGGGSTPPGSDVEAADTIRYIGENTPPTKALKSITDRFTEQTGIEVEYTLTPLLNYTEKLASDLTSGAGNFHALYVDPYNIGAPYFPELEPLNSYIEEHSYDMEDHIQIHIDACAKFKGDGTFHGLPYDCPTIMQAYRQDVFDEYGDQATDELGFEAEPNPEMTWEQYMEVARWINENVPDDMVSHGTGHMAKQHQSLANEFEMIQWGYGGTQLEGFDGKDPSVPEDASPAFTSDASVQAAEFYQELVQDVAHPGSTTWNWTGLAQAFAQGKCAMMPMWHEFNGLFADPESSVVPDKISWTLTPDGPGDQTVRSHYGGSSIGINSHATDAQKKAAWKFIEWTTSPEIQFELLKQAGGTPTRQSVYDRSEVQEASQQQTAESSLPNVVPPVLEGWKLENVGQRPHHPDWLQLEQVIYTEGSKMVNGDMGAQEFTQACNSGFSGIL